MNIVLEYHREARLSIGGVEMLVELKATPKGFVFWCSHWELIDDLKRLGVVRSESGPLHHRDYFLTDIEP